MRSYAGGFGEVELPQRAPRSRADVDAHTGARGLGPPPGEVRRFMRSQVVRSSGTDSTYRQSQSVSSKTCFPEHADEGGEVAERDAPDEAEREQLDLLLLSECPLLAAFSRALSPNPIALGVRAATGGPRK